MRRNPFFDTAAELLKGSGASLSIRSGGKHEHIVVALGDRVFRYPFPGSSGDHRSLANWRSQFRYRLGDLLPPKKGGRS